MHALAVFRECHETFGKDAAVSRPNGEILPGSIAEIGYHRLGGLDQWVMIRGKSLANPLLILLHGGPAFPEMRLFRTFNAELEKCFTVVYWEQRGTDKSFDRNIPTHAARAAGAGAATVVQLKWILLCHSRRELW
jgi:pimeloyl-ACP methyl ester carboxylesterase